MPQTPSHPAHTKTPSHENTKLVAFDLDDTLAETKSPIDPEMAGLLRELLRKIPVAVISGGFWPQFERQLLGNLDATSEELRNLLLFPTCGADFRRYEEGQWKQIYAETLSPREKARIFRAIAELQTSHFFTWPEEIFSAPIEDRVSQITFSATGQYNVPLDVKYAYDPDHVKRRPQRDFLAERLEPEFEVRIGGTTSLDVTRPGIDKAHGVRNMCEALGCQPAEILFVGDSLGPGGNDEPAKKAGATCRETTGPEETKRITREILGAL